MGEKESGNILKRLEGFKHVVIQCHDNPDADALAAGYGVYEYFKSKGKKVRLVYSGREKFLKSNLKIMLKELRIPAEYVTKLGEAELLVLVDCQYGEGNVAAFPARQVAMIDHHKVAVTENDMTDIRESYGSCSTLVYRLLLENGFDVRHNRNLSTALYYGLYMDTNGFSELRHPYDMDMMDDLIINDAVMDKMKNANFSLKEMETAGIALIRNTLDRKNRCLFAHANPCDPNILGLISDFVIQVDCVDNCIIYNENGLGYKLSVRSCTRETTAADLVEFITEGVGSGGGHTRKAGGFIQKSRLKEIDYDATIENFLYDRVDQYFSSYDFIDSNRETVDIKDMKRYRKRPMETGFVPTLYLASEGARLLIRTLEGEIKVVAEENTFLTIGSGGEIYLMDRRQFERSYKVLGHPCQIEAEYLPRVTNLFTNETRDLLPFARTCISTETFCVYARQIEKTVKLLTRWDYESCVVGKRRDYLVVREDDLTDMYITKEKIFEKMYEPV